MRLLFCPSVRWYHGNRHLKARALSFVFLQFVPFNTHQNTNTVFLSRPEMFLMKDVSVTLLNPIHLT